MAYTPNPTIINAGTGTGNINQIRRPLDISQEVAYYEPNANPFFLLAQKASSKETKDPRFECLEAQKQPDVDAINAGAGYPLGTETGLVVDHDEYFKAGDLVQMTRTGEILRVTAVTAATSTLTVVRGYGTVAGAPIVNDDEIMRLGNAFEEGANADTSKTVQIDNIRNYTQIFKTSVTITRTVKNTTLYGGDELSLRHKIAGVEHSKKIERQFLYGQRAEYLTTSATNPTTNHPLRMTGGILSFLSSNQYSAGGAISEASFNKEFLRHVYDADGDVKKTRTLFVSSLVGSIMNAWGNGKVQLVPSDKTFGITVNRYQCFFGAVNIVLHPLLSGAIYGGYAIAVDLENVGYRYLAGSDTTLDFDIIKSGADQQVDQFLTECGLSVRLEAVHGYAYGITG